MMPSVMRLLGAFWPNAELGTGFKPSMKSAVMPTSAGDR
jgi:hypothetical protein